MSRSTALALTADLSLGLSRRLMTATAALLLLTAGQLVAASCTPEPAPYAARAVIER
ncbi:MAG: hypothetical protein ACK4Z5_10930 [Brevundimonas sp.]